VVVDAKGFVTLLDSDSMQFTDPRTRSVFPCTVFTANYAPPELQATDFPRSEFTDDFSLAVLVLQLLLCGDHPFLGQPAGGGEAQWSDNIRLARSHLIAPGLVLLPHDAVPADVLPAEIRRLAVKALGDGHLDPRRRPSAADWAQELGRVHSSVSTCRNGHSYSQQLDECPWCGRLTAKLHDPFGKTLAPAASAIWTTRTWAAEPTPRPVHTAAAQPVRDTRQRLVIGRFPRATAVVAGIWLLLVLAAVIAFVVLH
jgi:eukaryotic-like serine/threonine-protein kinase